MTPQSAKAKGRKFQQHVAKRIQETFNLPAEDVQSTSMGAGGLDIKLSSAARSRFPFGIECKSLSKVAVYKFYDQAKTNTALTEYPLVVFKENGREPLVVLDFEDFLELMEECGK